MGTHSTPAEWLGDIANRVIHRKAADHARKGEYGLIHAGRHDFEQEFELPLKIIIAQAELKILVTLASQAPPGLGRLAIDKQSEIDKLYFDLARKDRPDGR